MGEQGVALHLPPDAPPRIMPADASPHLQAEAGFGITAILSHAQLQGGGERGAIGQGDGTCGRQPQVQPGDTALGGLKVLPRCRGGV